MEKHWQDCTKKEFESLPFREAWDKPIICNSLVILPTRRKHESGWRNMDFVAIKNGKPICRVSGCSDVLHFDGLGGYGLEKGYSTTFVPFDINPKGWTMDCLAKSGLLHIWCNGEILIGNAMSSLEIYAIKQEEKTMTHKIQNILNS